MSGINSQENAVLTDVSVANIGTATAPALQVIAADTNRQYLYFFNPTAVVISIGVVNTITTAGAAGAGIVSLQPGGSHVYEGRKVAGNAFFAVAASGSNNALTIWEA